MEPDALTPAVITGGIALLGITLGQWTAWRTVLRSEHRAQAEHQRLIELEDINEQIRALREHMRTVLAVQFTHDLHSPERDKSVGLAQAEAVAMNTSHRYRVGLLAFLGVRNEEQHGTPVEDDLLSFVSRYQNRESFQKIWNAEVEALAARRTALITDASRVRRTGRNSANAR